MKAQAKLFLRTFLLSRRLWQSFAFCWLLMGICLLLLEVSLALSAEIGIFIFPVLGAVVLLPPVLYIHKTAWGRQWIKLDVKERLPAAAWPEKLGVYAFFVFFYGALCFGPTLYLLAKRWAGDAIAAPFLWAGFFWGLVMALFLHAEITGKRWLNALIWAVLACGLVWQWMR